MLPDRVSNPGPLTYESGALPIALRGPACPWEGLQQLVNDLVVLGIKIYEIFPFVIKGEMCS